jgi:hypothetical protein
MNAKLAAGTLAAAAAFYGLTQGGFSMPSSSTGDGSTSGGSEDPTGSVPSDWDASDFQDAWELNQSPDGMGGSHQSGTRVELIEQEDDDGSTGMVGL